MGANFDSNIVINVSLDAPVTSDADFGTVLVYSLATFSEWVRTYESPADASADADIPQSTKDAISLAFSQFPRPARVKVGRRLPNVAKEQSFTIDTADSGDWVLTLNGTPYTYNASGGDTVVDVAQGISDELVGEAEYNVSYTPGADSFTVEAAVAGVDFTTELTVPGSGAATIATLAENVSPTAGLQQVLAEDSAWYGLVSDLRAFSDQKQIASYIESQEKIYMAYTADANCLDAANTDNIAYFVNNASYARTAVFYHSDAATVEADAAWMAGKLSVNPTKQSTMWSYYTLAGVSIDNITATQKSVLLGRNGNCYLTLGGIGATGMGTMGDGTKIDLRLAADWVKNAIETEIYRALINASNRGSKIPFDDTGFPVIIAAADVVLSIGENAGHFVRGSKVISAPSLNEISAADRQDRRYSFSAGVEPAGAVEQVNPLNIYISTDLSALS